LAIGKIKLSILSAILLFNLSTSIAASDWLDIVRGAPYRYSQNFHSNLSVIREWVLLEKSFCQKIQRHILFSERGVFLGYINNLESKQLTQDKLNQTRERLFNQNKVTQWIAGDDNVFGYPFALNCDQPHTNVKQATDRLFGVLKEDRLWGTWDGISAGSKSSPISLLKLVEQVYKVKSTIISQPIEAIEFRYFLAQIIIESGAKKSSISKSQAIGLLQLKTNVLKDCQIAEQFYQHRMAQVDCAIRLFYQNRRVLEPAFNAIFSALPKTKRQTVFALLLVQSYHTGIGRIIRLLNDKDFNQAAVHFSNNHQNYSAEDIATGLIFHNLGRTDLGFASLFYVVDVAIVAKTICQQVAASEQWFCQN
jgi:hypothetical protein